MKMMMFLKFVSCDFKMNTKLFVLFYLFLWNKTANIAYISINDLYIFLYKLKTFTNKTKKQDSISCSSCENKKFLSNVKIFSSSRKKHNWSTNFMFLIFMLNTYLMLFRVIEFCVTWSISSRSIQMSLLRIIIFDDSIQSFSFFINSNSSSDIWNLENEKN
jgi:hypothetical protein